MRLVTLTTDYGQSDYYVAALKLRLKQMDLNLDILDITHQLEPTFFLQAAYTLRAISSQSPIMSLHILSMKVDTGRWLLVWENNQYYLFPDNGLISCFDFGNKARVYYYDQTLFRSTFDDIGIIASAVNGVYGDLSIEDSEVWMPTQSYKTLIIPQVKHDKQERLLQGIVIYTDRYNNAVTNIRKSHITSDMNLKSIRIVSKYGHEIQDIQEVYVDTQKNATSDSHLDLDGAKGAVFNSLGYLEIYMYNSSHSLGGAATLLGFEPLSEVDIYY